MISAVVLISKMIARVAHRAVCRAARAVSASAWNIVGGYAGQVSVGHSMFFGLGAYTPLLFYTQWGWPPMAAIPVAIALSI